MATDLSAPNSAVGELIRHTLDGFRLESSKWEHDVEALFSDIDRFLGALPGSMSVDSGAVSDDLANLKGLVEQQTDVLTALVNALTGQPAPESASTADGVIDSVIDQFEQLQQTDGI